MNTPNRITIFRMFIVPVFLTVYFSNVGHVYLFSAMLFALGSITDAVDGHLARKNNIVTNFGKLLDPIADKILVTAALLAMMKDNLCDIWIVMIILVREFAITSVRMLAASNGVVIPANIGGKIKTAMQMFSVTAVLLMCEADAVFNLDLPLALISNILLGITAAIAVVSGAVYLIDSRKVIDYTK